MNEMARQQAQMSALSRGAGALWPPGTVPPAPGVMLPSAHQTQPQHMFPYDPSLQPGGVGASGMINCLSHARVKRAQRGTISHDQWVSSLCVLCELLLVKLRGEKVFVNSLLVLHRA